VQRRTARGQGRAALFLFSFLMVLREGAETAIFLSASSLNSEGLGRWLGALAGLALATTFGVLFARGTLRIPLRPFFSLTSAVLILIGVQLVVGGLHELSEAQVLPSSRAEMALIGPLIKNELLLFTLTVALAAGWLLAGPGRAPAAAPAEGPAARLERAARGREGMRRRVTGLLAVLVVACLSVAFARSSRVPGREPALPVAVENGAIRMDSAPLSDHRMHFYEATVDSRPVRFFAVQTDGGIRTCLDACEICGDKGYFLENGHAVCRNCTSPIPLSSLGRTGGCNPIPLPVREADGALWVKAADLEREIPRLKGR